jgi:tRNA threonylcarbamoyladenosine modification (KEOPS) complex Cgi121 subunit
MTIPGRIDTTAHSTSMRQIHAAIELMHRGEFECAIVLAHAAEGILPATDKPHTFQKVKALSASLASSDEQGAKGANDFTNWLKHGNGPDGKRIENAKIHDHEAIGMITRAISKFASVYQQKSSEMEGFIDWAIKHLQSA